MHLLNRKCGCGPLPTWEFMQALLWMLHLLKAAVGKDRACCMIGYARSHRSRLGYSLFPAAFACPFATQKLSSLLIGWQREKPSGICPSAEVRSPPPSECSEIPPALWIQWVLCAWRDSGNSLTFHLHPLGRTYFFGFSFISAFPLLGIFQNSWPLKSMLLLLIVFIIVIWSVTSYQIHHSERCHDPRFQPAFILVKYSLKTTQQKQASTTVRTIMRATLWMAIFMNVSLDFNLR